MERAVFEMLLLDFLCLYIKSTRSISSMASPWLSSEPAQWQRDSAFVAPGPGGAHNWHPMAFSPVTRLVYLPAQQTPYP